ncbi:MAG: hypothetical protein ACO1SV_00795 [Fimbriimonas sp.]
MARETLPKEKVQRAPNRVPWGKAEWGRTLENPQELIRRREGCVGEDGIRRIRLGKTAPEYDDPRLFDHYQERGYEIADKGYYFELSISQTTYEEQERRRNEADRRRLGPQPKDPAFDRDEDVNLAPVSASDVLGNGD